MTQHLTQEDIDNVPDSKWYQYTLECEHVVYSRTRIIVPKTFHEHFIRCPQCKNQPTNWKAIVAMEAATDEHVSNVLSGTSFVLSKRFLRTNGTDRSGARVPSGNPLPYTVRDVDY